MDATYDPDDNKLRLRSVSRLDPETYARVKAAGFAWAPRQDLFVAPAWTPAREDLLLELCAEIGDEDTSLVERAEQRADRFGGYSERRAADSSAAREAVAAIADGIPFGQPILVGHHSERHARRDAERIRAGMDRAVRMWDTARYWEQRAAGSVRAAKYKERPDVRARRIKKLEAEERGYQRTLKRSEQMARLWARPGLTLETALKIANHIGGGEVWSDLRDGKITPADAAAKETESHERMAADARRWLAHLANRLAYERAQLAASGWTPPPKPKTKSDLPLLNYAGEVAYRDLYHDKIERAQATGVTRAQLAKLHPERKGTRLSACGTHRIRVAYLGGIFDGISVVYLTDAKQHERPSAEAVEAHAAAESDEAIAERLRKAEARATARAARPTPEGADEVEALRESLRSGVQVVSAPELFPTPGALAARMAELANVQPGERVLEPSAGTGMLMRALSVPAQVTAVEQNPRLADALAKRYPAARVVRGDFLTAADLGEFDAVVMNPPFSADVQHIRRALGLLRPGGRLVAVCAGGPRQEAALRPLADSWEELPVGTFVGTSVRAVLLTSRRPNLAAAPTDGLLPAWQAEPSVESAAR